MPVKGKGKGKEVETASSSKRKGSSSASAGKRRRSGVLKFVDDAAYVADDDEEEDDPESEDDFEDFLDELAKEGEEAPVEAPKGKGKSFLPFLVKEEELSGDELEAIIKERYGCKSGLKYAGYEDEFKDMAGPDPTKDPTIWRLKCGVGHERQVVFCFMQKYVDFHNRGNKLQIFSAFALDHVKGYVYVEADKACDVTEACKGFCNVYVTRINAVPASEVPHLLAVRSKPSVVSQGAWVRLKSGNYKGDIAQVVSLDDGRNKVLIKLIPRIDLQAISQKFGGAISLKNASVPTARLINPRELEVFRPHIELKRDRQSGVTFEVLDGNMLKDGYLFKRVALNSLIYWGVEPTDRERVQFSSPSGEGQQVDPDEWVSDLYDRCGRKKSRASTSADPKASASEPMDDSGFGIHDLVLFGKKDFGVILGLEKDGLYKILTGDMEGVPVVTIKKHDIKKVCADKMFTALDRNKKCLSINDPVDVSEGPNEGKKGVVKHMFKGVLFILDQNETENGGFFCAKAEHCVNTKNSEEMPPPPMQSFSENLDDNAGPSFAPSSPGLFQQDNTRGSGRRRQERESLFSIGQTLRIRKGPLKGYLCRVVRMYRNDITVKLDSLVKILTVDAEFLTVPTKRGTQADESGAAGASDIFGVQGSEGGSSWDTTLPSFASDAWQPFSSSTAATGTGDDRAGGDGDPWGSKLPSETTPDAWNSDKPSDTWGCATDRQAAASAPNGTWQKDDDSTWGNSSSQKNVADESGWCNVKGKDAASDDPWGTMVLKGPEEGADAWCQANNAASDGPTVKSDLWNSKGKETITEDAGGTKSDMWGKSKGESGSGDWNSTNTTWDAKGKGLANEDNSAWGAKATKSQDADTWGDKSDAWGQSTVKDGGAEGGSGWNSGGKAMGNSSMAIEDKTAWGQSKKDGGGESGGGWNSGGNASWDKPNASTWNSCQDDGGDKDNKPMDSWNSGGGFGGRGGRGSRGGGGSGRGGGRSGSGSGDCYKCGQSGHFARECPSAGNGGGGGRSGGGSGGCYKCGQSGHFARECPSAGNGGSQGGGGSCYKCGQTGHFARECPSADGSVFNSGGGGGGSRSGGGSNCYKCGEAGHFSRECPSAEGGGSRGGGGIGGRDCFKCGKPGHFARECPNDGGAAGGTWKSDKSEKPNFGSSWGNDHAGDNSWSKKPESWTNDSVKGWGNLQADVEKKNDLNSSSWSKDVSEKKTTGGADNWNATTHLPEETQGADPWASNLTPGQVTHTSNAWSASIEGKTKEHDSWNNNQKTKELDPWGSNQKTEASSSKTDEAEVKEVDPWSTKSTCHPGSDNQDDPWSKKVINEKKTAAETGGWNAGRSGQTQSDNWGNSGNDSDWCKPKVSLADGNNDGSAWGRPSWSSDSGGCGRGRGRGRNFGDRRDSNDGGRGGNWRGRGGGRYGGSQGGRGGKDGSGSSAPWNGGGSSWNRDENSGNSWSNTDSKKSSEWGGGWGDTSGEKEKSNDKDKGNNEEGGGNAWDKPSGDCGW